MDPESKDGFITIDETVSESLLSANDSLNDSKRKVDDNDLDCFVESIHPRKKLCRSSMEGGRSASDSQILTVVFRSQDIARKYNKEIADFVSQLTKSEITTTVEKDGKPCLEFYKGIDEHRDKQVEDAKFVNNHEDDSVDVLPQYEQTFSGVIGASSVEKKETGKPRNMCFNCEGDHMIAACPEPRDAARIAKNRREYANKNPVYNRYHEEADQKFGHVVPGHISVGLREALGLRDGDLPLHTYRMRVQGYPPGWLRSARVQRSNISVHHDPTTGSDKGPNKASEKEEDHYDLTKLVSFPGFNVDHPGGFRDDHHRKGFPAMQKYWSLHTMKKRLRTVTARRPIHPRKPADLPTNSKEDNTQDMDVVSDDDSPDTAGTPTEGDSNGDREGSPSLEALEEQRRALLNSLDTDEPEPEPELEDSQLVHAPPPAAHSTPQAPVLTPGASRRRELGTPVAAGGHVAYNAEKWSAGITEHIPYENLPGATGAWDRMSSLMKKVRDQLTGKI